VNTNPTAKTCPVHAVVLPGCPHPNPVDTYRIDCVKDRPGSAACWTASDGGCFSDGQIDQLIAEGAFLTRVPAGRGRWLAQEREARRG
jgi:hypothetical protein